MSSSENTSNIFVEHNIPDSLHLSEANFNISDPLPIDLNEAEINELVMATNNYSQNYVNTLSDLIEPFPVQIADIILPYSLTQNLTTKLKKTQQWLRQALRLKNRKQTLIMLFLLGQLLNDNNVSNSQAADHGINRYYRRIALRVFYLFQDVGVQQILRSTKVTVRSILNLKQHEFEQLIEGTRFAGAQI
jgi:hypothetical protein